MSAYAPPDNEVNTLRAQVEHYRRVVANLNASLWARDELRHDFDAIRNDCCPSCGGPVVVRDVGRGLVLEATRL